MKKFENPKVEVVHFEKMDVLTTNSCDCVECPDGCGEGSFDCTHNDFPTSDISSGS